MAIAAKVVIALIIQLFHRLGSVRGDANLQFLSQPNSTAKPLAFLLVLDIIILLYILTSLGRSSYNYLVVLHYCSFCLAFFFHNFQCLDPSLLFHLL